MGKILEIEFLNIRGCNIKKLFVLFILFQISTSLSAFAQTPKSYEYDLIRAELSVLKDKNSPQYKKTKQKLERYISQNKIEYSTQARIEDVERLIQEQKYNSAIYELNDLIENNIEPSLCYMLLGDISFKSAKNPKKTASYYKQSLQYNPDNYLSSYKLAKLYLKENKNILGIEYLKHTIQKTNDENVLLSEFKDDLTAFNAEKKGSESGKGALNCDISTKLFELLEKNGIKTHLVEKISKNEQLVKKCEIIKIEVIVRNVATGSLSKRLGIKDGEILPFALVEFCLKDDALGDPFINDEHCLLLNLVSNKDEIELIKQKARKINEILLSFFAERKLRLIDFKIEFGKDKNGEIILADEISPDSCRFWDKDTNEKLDKDRFRQNLGSVKVAYEEVLRRILKDEK